MPNEQEKHTVLMTEEQKGRWRRWEGGRKQAEEKGEK